MKTFRRVKFIARSRRRVITKSKPKKASAVQPTVSQELAEISQLELHISPELLDEEYWLNRLEYTELNSPNTNLKD